MAALPDMEVEQFRIDPLVVFKLGEELISDESQALLELIKNAYDADASYARVAIHTTGTPPDLIVTPESNSDGWVEITDDGVGMTDEQIRDGWLLIARSAKRTFKEEGRVTDKQRTPLGDKGLGRLGTQRLGWFIQIATKVAGAEQERVLAFSWEDFVTAESLDKVKIDVGLRKTDRPHGTVLTIAELQDRDRWTGQRITDLQEELAELISPYEGVSGFLVTASVDGTDLDLRSLSREVLDTAQLHYDISFEDGKLAIDGRATLGLFRPSGGKAAAQYREFVEDDNGQALMDHLLEQGGAGAVKLKRAGRRWFATFGITRDLADMSPEVDDDGQPVTPGPFTARVDSFNLGAGDDTTVAVFGKLQEYRDFIKKLAGIRVYRDGFVVRTDADWLRLGEQWTSAPSYYGLKPDTTLGFVAISSRDNPQLVEKTDREGFVDDAAYRNFFTLMQQFRIFTEEVQELLRREYVTFVKERLRDEAEVDEDTDAEDVSSVVDETLAEAEQIKQAVTVAQAAVGRAVADAEDAAETMTADDADGRYREIVENLRAALQEAQRTLRDLDAFLTRIETAREQNQLVREEIVEMRRQLEIGVEAMSLGLTAEALSHEMFTIADGLSVRTQGVVTGLEDGSMTFAKVRRFVQYVRGSVAGLRKELGHFSPSMRYVRERREKIDIADFVAEIAEYYQGHWGDEKVEVKVIDKSRRRFMVRTGRGRLTQVLDNLMLNSRYWVGEAQKQKLIKKGLVTITLQRPRLVVSDNGQGVEASVESSLFDAFVTRKPRGTGRGLGLFVVRQLLGSQDSTIELGPDRNGAGRRHEFIVNLSGMLDDG